MSDELRKKTIDAWLFMTRRYMKLDVLQHTE
jgi:hypothetical protein